jgi:hypothetical protein
MINTIQGQKIRLCQWSGQPIPAGHLAFRIPYLKKNKAITWKGCYITPQCALAALKKFSDLKGLEQEKHTELFEIFQSSLRRVGGDEGSEHINLKLAPDPKTLVIFGGDETIDAYRARYDPLGNSHLLFSQVIPAEEPISDEGGKSWNITSIVAATPSTKDELKECQTMKDRCPRNIAKVIKYLEQAAIDGELAVQLNNGFVVLPKPDSETFAIASVDETLWNEDAKRNMLARRLLGYEGDIFGNVMIFHKTKLKLKKRKRSPPKAKEEIVEAAGGVVVSEPDEEPAEPTEPPKKVAPPRKKRRTVKKRPSKKPTKK